MLVFSGVWCHADREGRFEWRPKQLKLDILPFLDFDMGAVLDSLAAAKYLRKYEVGGSAYGQIENWSRHQIPGRDEPPSEIPAPDGSMTAYDRPPNQTQRIKIYARDNYTCRYCGRNMRNDSRAMCLDHVIPYAKGGTNREANLATACKKCNASKASRTPKEAGMPWPEGLGETYDNPPSRKKNGRNSPVKPPLTVLGHPPDKEGELDREGELELDGEREGDREWVALGAASAPTELTGKALRDAFWEAIKTATGFNPVTKDEKSRLGKIVTGLIAKGATPDQVPIRASRYRRTWAGMSLTPEAMFKHWDAMGAETAKGINGASVSKQEIEDTMRRVLEGEGA